MYKIIISLVAGLVGCASSYAQQLPPDFKVQFINQPVKAFKDTVDLSTPLSSYITMAYMMSRGEQGRWRSVSSRSAWGRLPDPGTPCDSVSERVRNYYLNQQTYQIITYKDSLARVTAAYGDSGMLSIRSLAYQNNRWVNLGEDIQADSTAVYNKFVNQAEEFLQQERDRNKLKILRSDTTSFVDYLRRHASAPKTYLLEKLGQHKVVIYGELHMRKHSWDFLRSVLADKRFADRTGTIFLELPSFTRSRFEAFFNAPEPDSQIILEILSQEQRPGWEDRGQYEFILDVWKLNRKLPKEKRIRIIPVDNQLDWSTILSEDDYKRARDEYTENRDHHMARTIAEYLQHDADGRNGLFVVGFNHARKYATGMAEGVGTAGKQLTERMPAGTSGRKKFRSLIFLIEE